MEKTFLCYIMESEEAERCGKANLVSQARTLFKVDGADQIRHGGSNFGGGCAKVVPTKSKALVPPESLQRGSNVEQGDFSRLGWITGFSMPLLSSRRFESVFPIGFVARLEALQNTPFECVLVLLSERAPTV